MASWTDGPEYAPHERPDAFVAPDAAPLAPADGTHRPLPGAPAEPPAYAEPTASVPLADVAPPAGPSRDPREAFEVVTTPLTQGPGTLTPTTPAPAAPATPTPLPPPTASWPTASWPTASGPTSAWGSAHAPTAHPRPTAPWGPDQPVALPPQPPQHVAPPWGPVHPAATPPSAPWPQPGTPDWFAAPPPPGPVPPAPVTVAQIVASVTPGVLISLGLGALLGFFALPLLFVAHVLSARTRHRRRLVGLLFRIVESAVLLLGAFGMVEGYGGLDLVGWWDAATRWAAFGNLTLAVALPLVVADALRRGEPAEPW